MARKVLLSFLGTDNYIETHYQIDIFKSPLVRFVQEAIIDHLCTDWGQDDRIYVFLTDAARVKNWENYEQREGKHISCHPAPNPYINDQLSLPARNAQVGF